MNDFDLMCRLETTVVMLDILSKWRGIDMKTLVRDYVVGTDAIEDFVYAEDHHKPVIDGIQDLLVSLEESERLPPEKMLLEQAVKLRDIIASYVVGVIRNTATHKYNLTWELREFLQSGTFESMQRDNYVNSVFYYIKMWKSEKESVVYNEN